MATKALKAVKQPKTKRSSKRWTITDGTGKSLTVDGHKIIRDVATACRELSKDKVIGIDTETTGLNAWRDNIALVQMFGEQTGTLAVLQIRDGVIPDPIKDLFKKSRTFVIHNGVGFDMWFMNNAGIPWEKATWHDTLVAETVLASSGRRDVSKSLRASLRRRLGKEIDKDIEHGQWGAQKLSDRQLEYAAQDVLSLPALRQAHLDKAKQSEETTALEMEMELAPLVARMAINGLPLRRRIMEEYIKKQYVDIADAEKFLHKKLGKINLGSHVQLKNALHQVGIPVESTGKEVLEPLLMIDGPHLPVIEQLLVWKHGAQRIKMYKPEWMDNYIIDDYIHPHFWQCSADTTRFTSSDPNLQQIPKDSRYIIGNIPGTKIVSVDYSQIEVRIAAYVAQDEVLMEALQGEDIHRAVAAAVYGIPEEQVTPGQRKIAKAMTFLLLFGGGVPKFYQYIKMAGGVITYEDAAELVFKFFSRFQGLKRMKDKASYVSKKPGPMFIRLPNTNRRILVGQSKRTTVILNTMVQGSAAVGIKHGIIEASKRGLLKYMGGQVHDEIVSAVPAKEAKDYAEEMVDAMIVGMHRAVDTFVKAEPKIGDTWQP